MVCGASLLPQNDVECYTNTITVTERFWKVGTKNKFFKEFEGSIEFMKSIIFLLFHEHNGRVDGLLMIMVSKYGLMTKRLLTILLVPAVLAIVLNVTQCATNWT